MCTRGAVGSDFQFLVCNLACESFDASRMCSTRARQTDVSGIDAERFHQMKQFEFLFDWRLANGWRLQTVAQGFVIDADVTIWRGERRLDCVPVVNELVDGHVDSISHG